MTSKRNRQPRKHNKKPVDPHTNGGNKDRAAKLDKTTLPQVHPSPEPAKNSTNTRYKSSKWWWKCLEFVGIMAGIAYAVVTVLLWWGHRKDDRPYVVKTPDAQSSHLTISDASGTNPNLTTHFHNIGKSTAFDTTHFGCLVMVDRNKLGDADIIMLSDRMYSVTIKQLGLKSDLAPTTDFYSGVYLSQDTCPPSSATYPQMIWTDDLIEKFKTGDVFILGLVGVVYSGSDGPHETQYCEIFTGNPSLGLPHLCPTHNTIR